MNKSESIDMLAAALEKFNKKDIKIVATGKNPAFKKEGVPSTYIKLNDILNAVKVPLADVGLSLIQLMDESESGVVVETMLLHTSGQWILGRGRMTPSKSDPQSIMSAVTYLRRGGIGAIIGILTDEDDDGNAASNKVDNTEKESLDADTANLMIDEISQAESIAAVDALGKKNLKAYASLSSHYQNEVKEAAAKKRAELKGDK